MNENHNELASFIVYCNEHPTQRFWQALRNWSGRNFIFASDTKPAINGLDDTFYWRSRTGSRVGYVQVSGGEK